MKASWERGAFLSLSLLKTSVCKAVSKHSHPAVHVAPLSVDMNCRSYVQS